MSFAECDEESVEEGEEGEEGEGDDNDGVVIAVSACVIIIFHKSLDSTGQVSCHVSLLHERVKVVAYCLYYCCCCCHVRGS